MGLRCFTTLRTKGSREQRRSTGRRTIIIRGAPAVVISSVSRRHISTLPLRSMPHQASASTLAEMRLGNLVAAHERALDRLQDPFIHVDLRPVPVLQIVVDPVLAIVDLQAVDSALLFVVVIAGDVGPARSLLLGLGGSHCLLAAPDALAAK